MRITIDTDKIKESLNKFRDWLRFSTFLFIFLSVAQTLVICILFTSRLGDMIIFIFLIIYSWIILFLLGEYEAYLKSEQNRKLIEGIGNK